MSDAETLRQAQGPHFTETDVPDTRPRVGATLAWLLVGALVATLVVVFAVWTVTHVLRVGSEGAPLLSLSDVEQRSGIDLPDGTVVLASARTPDVFSAEVVLPADELPDFALAGYGEATAPSQALAAAIGDDLVTQYFAAGNAVLTGSAALVDRGGDTVLFVDVRAAD
jgi:hypothetical protein